MNKPKIYVEISTAGIDEISIDAANDEESSAAHELLGKVAPQLRSLGAALKLLNLETPLEASNLK